MSDFFKYICLFLGIPLQESKEDRIKHFVQYSQVLSHSKRTTNSLRKSIVDLPIETSTKHNTKISDNECGIRSVAEDNHAYSEGRHCEAWSPEEYEEDKNAPDTEVLPEAPDQDVVVKNFRYISASESTTDILQKIEKDAEKQIELLAEQDIPICEEICKNIMQRGADEFRQQTGRNMTYSEMRRAFG